MIENIKNIMESELDSILSNTICITEKLDLIYFKIRFDEFSYTVLKTPYFNSITDIDIICNSIYYDIDNFAKNVYEVAGKNILSIYGNCNIGFFYMPVSKTKVINYKNSICPNFILSDMHMDIRKDIYEPDMIDNIYHLMSDIDTLKNIPTIYKGKYNNLEILNIKELFCKYIENDTQKNAVALVKALTKNDISYTGLALPDIEGVILQYGKHKIQIIINDTNVTVDNSLLYRNMLLTDFANVILSNHTYCDKLIESTNSYIDIISELFIKYINNTDFFKKQYIEESDLLPPHIGYMGNILYNKLSNDTVRVICEYDNVQKNVFRLLLYTFNKYNPSKFNNIADNVKELLIEFSKKVN